MLTCNFCKKEYTSLSSLNYHQKTAVFCKKIQLNISLTSNTGSISNLNTNANTKLVESNELKCNFCNKEFSTKFRLTTHLNICKERENNELKNNYNYEIDELKKQHSNQLEELKKEINELTKEHSNQLDELKKEISSLKKEHKKEIQLKDDYIQTLKNQLNIYIERTTLNSNNNSSVNTTNNNNNIINNINIKNEEYSKLFDLIKPMLSNNINSSMRNIRYDKMVDNVVESLDEYFINEFVKNFKDYVIVTDKSR